MRITFIIGFIIMLGTAYAQDIVIEETQTNTEYVDHCIARAEVINNGDSISHYYSKALLISEEIDYHKGQLAACEGLLDYHQNDEKIYDKLRYSLILIRIFNDHGSIDEKASAYNRLGSLYFEEKLYSKALEAYKIPSDYKGLSNARMFESNIGLVRSELYAKKLDDALISARKIEFNKSLTTLQEVELQKEKAEIYHRLRAYAEEEESYDKILKTIQGSEYSYLEPVIWNNIGYAKKYTGKNREATVAFKNTILKARGNKEMRAVANFNLGLIYHNDNKADSAVVFFEASMNQYNSLENLEEVANCLNMLAITYHNDGDQFNAQKEIDQAFRLEQEHGLRRQEARTHEIQSLIHTELFEYELALASYKEFLSIRESLKTDERLQEDRIYEVERIEKSLRTIWSRSELDKMNRAREKAETEREQKEAELQIIELKNKELRAKEALQRLRLREEKLNLENKKRELEIIQRDNELKELALEKERLVVSEKEKENKLLAQKNELEKQKRANEEQQYRSRLQFIGGILLFFILILIVISFAYRQLRKRKKRIEEQNIIISESKKEIELQKEKSEGLLLNILPSKVAEELKIKGASKPQLYSEVSVAFTDFSGFTMISEKLSPEQLVEKLDQMFLQFDKIIDDYGLQRIKTIGDAYMFASGLPDPIEDHATKIIKASIEMRDFITSFNNALAPDEPVWNIRIGINTGPVVAGVIGIRKFAYDIWGDTVNTAARMESSGEIGKVNISGRTHDLVKTKFQTVHRGKVAAKNKGDIDMYFVENL